MIDLAKLEEAIASPIEPDESREPLEETLEFDLIDQELMKRGTLMHESLDWSLVFENATKLMADHSKDLRLFDAAVQSSIKLEGVKALPTLLTSFHAFMSALNGAFVPAPQRKFEAILKRICIDLQKITPINWVLDKEKSEKFRLVIKSILENEAIKHTSGEDFLKKIASSIKEETDKIEQAPIQEEATVKSAKPALESNTPSPTDIDERQFSKRSGEVADLIFQLSPSAPLSFSLRRFSAWHFITSPPPTKTDNKTIVPSVPIDNQDMYEAGLLKAGPDLPLILKLERALVKLPFWFEGQFLAASLCEKWGWMDAEKTIKKELNLLLERLPILRELCFEDGQPFLSENASKWLSKTENVMVESNSDHDAIVNISELNDQLFAADYSTRFDLDERVMSSNSERKKALYELTSLENLAGLGLPELAKSQAKRLSKDLESIDLEMWDPEIFTRLEKLSSGV